MGLNFIAYCGLCNTGLWMFRGEESMALHRFWREHWDHRDELMLGEDQGDRSWESVDWPTTEGS